jgi:hypothetical protein
MPSPFSDIFPALIALVVARPSEPTIGQPSLASHYLLTVTLHPAHAALLRHTCHSVAFHNSTTRHSAFLTPDSASSHVGPSAIARFRIPLPRMPGPHPPSCFGSVAILAAPSCQRTPVPSNPAYFLLSPATPSARLHLRLRASSLDAENNSKSSCNRQVPSRPAAEQPSWQQQLAVLQLTTHLSPLISILLVATVVCLPVLCLTHPVLLESFRLRTSVAPPVYTAKRLRQRVSLDGHVASILLLPLRQRSGSCSLPAPKVGDDCRGGLDAASTHTLIARNGAAFVQHGRASWQ